VVHPATAEEMEEPLEEDNSASMSDLSYSMDHGKQVEDDGAFTATTEQPKVLFETRDILQELKILSLLLVERCNLLEDESLYEI
jgi:hypothetical protein